MNFDAIDLDKPVGDRHSYTTLIGHPGCHIKARRIAVVLGHLSAQVQRATAASRSRVSFIADNGRRSLLDRCP